MLFVAIGIVLIALHLLGIGPPARWDLAVFGDLWKFVVPFVLAVVWWAWSDASGLNKRRQMARMDAKKQKRREEAMTALKLGPRRGDKR